PRGPRLRRRRWRRPPPSKRLPEPNVDAELRIVGSGVERHADVDPQRAEAGVIARADASAELDLVEARRRVLADRARVNERHDTERSAEQAGADARLEREFGE